MATLGTVGIADKGIYNASTTYVTGNFVLYEGSTWLALKDNLTGVTPEEGENWKYLARGFGSDSLSQIEATDTSGVLGTSGATVVSQALIDAIADKVMTKLIPYTNIVNNFLATDPNTVLSGPMGKSLKDQLDTTNSNLVFATTTPTHNTSAVDTNNSKQRISQFLKILNVDINVKVLNQYTEYDVLYTGIMPSSRLSLRVVADTGKVIPVYLETNGTLKLNTVDSTTTFSMRFQIVA